MSHVVGSHNPGVQSATRAEKISATRLKAIFVGSSGNLVEWFDFYCYAAFALYFAGAFFPAQDTTAQIMSTAGVFALGFLVRPVGGFLFGYLGDRHGRRTALMVSVLMMCFGSLMIACAPTYQLVGIWSPIILLLARLVQGLSLGGEYGASATYLSEMATSRHRGFYSSFQYVTLIGGQLLALLLLMALQNLFLDSTQLHAWGWRIPFLIGAALALVALRMRHDLPETDAFQAARKAGKATGSFKELLRYPKESLIVIGFTMGGTLAFYVYTVYMQKFLRLSVGLTEVQTTAVSAASLVFAMCLQPLYGALSDRIGRKPLLIGFALCGTLFTVPLLTGIQHASGPWSAFALICCAWLIVSGYTSINALVKAELFPASIRATGVGVPYAFAVSIFGGSAEYVALWFKKAGHQSGFYWYATAVIACTLLVCWFMRDTRSRSLLDADQ
ncbi:MFS transporter [Limnobacter litoralis]|uniref:Alpha-ketoglutarate permease n=1 Tax=Limnobacter litoralis TaxID=481366 RepID=A0ABQ5YMM1_9BURK|nr:MFS transporter [Limnobacter litoralis]GLR25171.1 alpha-ketoglutarate permease [Limnobacter litoralis]